MGERGLYLLPWCWFLLASQHTAISNESAEESWWRAGKVNSLGVVHRQVREAKLSFFLSLYLPRSRSGDPRLGKMVGALECLLLVHCAPAVWHLWEEEAAPINRLQARE